jgi:osmotically-inducible protein OsmY
MTASPWPSGGGGAFFMPQCEPATTVRKRSSRNQTMITHCGPQNHRQRIVSDDAFDEIDIDVRNEPLTKQLHQSLQETGYFLTIPCDVTVRVNGAGHVSLHGIVPSYYLKQKAQIAVMSVDGVNSLRNELMVP